MLECLNLFGIDMACIGNHDFDFGVARARELTSKSNFPWLCSNIKLDGEPVVGHETQTLTKNDLKIGFFAVGDYEWFTYINDFHLEGRGEYEDYV
jgi:2',3'-cyclic-nucleotide 2'-phosphodiesterase (5'-nucleotidase family)